MSAAAANPMESGHLLEFDRQCTAHSKRSGNRCKRPAAIGQSVCTMHGAAAPQCIAAARRRILAAADPVTAELVRLATSADSESVRVAAARDILDRAGLGATHRISADVTTRDGDGELDREIRSLVAELGRLDQGEAPVGAAGAEALAPADEGPVPQRA